MPDRRTSLFCCAALLILGCSPQTPTQLFLRGEADPLTRERTRALRATVTSQDGEERLRHDFPVQGFGAHEWPIDLSILPLGGDASRRVTVKLEAIGANDAVFNSRTGRYPFFDGELLEVSMVLQDACIGVTCPEESTCEAGSCVPIDSIPIGPGVETQEGVCDGDICWEHPLPAGRGARSACAHSTGGGAVLGGAVVWLEDGLWHQEDPGLEGSLLGMTCWGPRRGAAHTGNVAALRGPDGWRSIPFPEGTHDVRRIWGDGPNNLWVVGDDALVLHFDGTAWSRPPGLESLTGHLRHIEGAPEGVHLFGQDGAFAFGTTLSPLDAPPGVGDIRDWLRHGDTVAVIADRAVHLRIDGRWQSPYLGHQNFGFRVVAMAGERIYAAGDRGEVESWDLGGTEDEWVRAANLRGASITSLASAPDHIIATADNGTVGRLVQDVWLSTTVPQTRAALIDVAANDAGDVAAVGVDGVIMHRNAEGRWQRRVAVQSDGLPSRSDFRAVASQGNEFWAAGESVVLHSDTGERWDIVHTEGDQQWRALCVGTDEVLVAGDGGTIVTLRAGVSNNTRVPGVDLLSCLALPGEPSSFLLGSADGILYTWRDGVASPGSNFGAPITAIAERPGQGLAIIAGGELFATDAEGVCPAPCSAEPSPSSELEAIHYDDEGWLWYLAEGRMFHRHRSYASGVDRVRGFVVLPEHGALGVGEIGSARLFAAPPRP